MKIIISIAKSKKSVMGKFCRGNTTNIVSYLALQEPLPLHRLRQKRGYKPYWQSMLVSLMITMLFLFGMSLLLTLNYQAKPNQSVCQKMLKLNYLSNKSATKKKKARLKAQADKELNDFRLTGSSLPSDVAASYGQGDMFVNTWSKIRWKQCTKYQQRYGIK